METKLSYGRSLDQRRAVFQWLKSSMDKNSMKNINVFHFFGHQFLVYLACESVAPLGVQTAHILVFQNTGRKNVLCRNATFACFVPAPLH